VLVYTGATGHLDADGAAHAAPMLPNGRVATDDGSIGGSNTGTGEEVGDTGDQISHPTHLGGLSF